MAEIPTEICRAILLQLPAKSLISFRSVCKSWRHVIEDPSFVKAHTNKQLSSNTILIRNSTGPPFYPLYSVDLETLHFTDGLQTITATPLTFSPGGLSRLSDLADLDYAALPLTACNGLMLVPPSPMDDQNIWEIWNPLTHERLELPRLDIDADLLASGLGYDHATDDYKAVVIDLCPGHSDGEKNVYETHVYSLKSDSWRKIMDCPCDDVWWGPDSAGGVFLNGSLHWILRDKIIVLDLTTEKYRNMKCPPLEEREEIMVGHTTLDVLSGCLIVSNYEKDDYENHFYDVWVMKDYGAQDSWIKLFDLNMYSIPDLGLCLRPVAYIKDKMQMFLQDRMGFYLFDVRSNTVMMVSIHGLSGNLAAQIFHRSIIRLHDNCGVSESVARERRIRTRDARKMKMKFADTKLVFCLRNYNPPCHSHDSCYSKDSSWCYSSIEDED